MMKRFLIIVEGEADKKFFKDYYHHLFQEKAPEGRIIPYIQGKMMIYETTQREFHNGRYLISFIINKS